MMAHEDVEIRTLDGTILRGHLFPAKGRGPGVVMSPGVSLSANADTLLIKLLSHSRRFDLVNERVFFQSIN